MEVADLEQALQVVVAALGPAREQVAAVGVTGMAESGVPLLAGRPAAPIIAWHDGRGEVTVASLDARFGPDLSRWTGRRLRTVSSMGRRLRTVSSVAKIGWLLDHGLAVPDRWLGVPELVLWLLTGVEATEHSLAARTGAYDVTGRRFIPEVIAHVLAGSQPASPFRDTAEKERQIDELFPPVRRAGTAMGPVLDSAAAAFGLPAGIPVTIAGHDHLAAAVGLGPAPGDLLNSVGTAETVFRRLADAPDVERALELDLAVTVWPGGEAWCVLASSARSGVVLGDLAASLSRAPAELDRLAAPVVGSPAESDPAAASGGDPGRAWATVLADLAGRTVAAGARVADLVGPHDRLVVFGGGSGSGPWLAAKAAMAGVPVLRPTVTDAAARGAALAAGATAGWWPAGGGPTPALELVDPAQRQ
jgi:xylulokinase